MKQKKIEERYLWYIGFLIRTKNDKKYNETILRINDNVYSERML